MKTKKKLFAGIVGFTCSMALFFGVNGTVQAADSSSTDYLNSGVGMILDPSCMDTAEKLSETAEKLNVSLDSREEEKESTLVMVNVQQMLNVRSDATTESGVLGYLYKDCGGEILERKDGWTKLRSGNLIGWASDEYLLFDEEAETLADDAGKLVASVNVETLRVRGEAGEDAEVLGLLPKGELLEVVDQEDGQWIKVDYEGQDGYVLAEYVTLDFQIDAGETIEEVKAREEAEREAKRHVNYGAYTTDADTTLLLAALIQCEAGGEPYEGQLAVGAVVMNRVRSAAYPDSIHGVIYASGQFTPALNGKVNRVYESGKIYESCVRAAEEALSGVSNVGDLTHFRRNNGREGLVIGHHVFY